MESKHKGKMKYSNGKNQRFSPVCFDSTESKHKGEFRKLKDIIMNNGFVKVQRNIANEMYADNYSIKCIGFNFDKIFNRLVNDFSLKICLSRYNRSMNSVNYYVTWNDFSKVIYQSICEKNSDLSCEYLQINRDIAKTLYEHYYPIYINYSAYGISRFFIADKNEYDYPMEESDAYSYMPCGTRRKYFVKNEIMDLIQYESINSVCLNSKEFENNIDSSEQISIKQKDVVRFDTEISSDVENQRFSTARSDSKESECVDLNQVIQEFVRRFRIQVEDELKQKYVDNQRLSTDWFDSLESNQYESVISEYQYKLNVANSELNRLQNILESFKKILSSN